eukprot:scaffold62657_cov64-Phaeocystis_antarctica.AAC.4
MSVMAETSQSEMGPHVAVAAVGFALNAWTAVIREALVVKIQAEGGGGLGGGSGSEGGGGGGGDGDGGEGQLPGPQLESYSAEAKAEVPAHAQRISSLLASDKEGVDCRVERRAYRGHTGRGARCRS